MKRLGEIALNIFLIVTCTLTCADIVRRFIASKRIATSMETIGGPARGAILDLSGFDWSRSGSGTLVFGIATTCHFCTQSAPFYKRLLTSVHDGIGVVAIAPQPVEQTKEYLERLGVAITEVRQAQLQTFGIGGTPTLVFVDRRGMVERVWRGALSKDREQDLVDFVSRVGR
jgi:hypothetical protein